jgi:hypothetical protein
MAMLDPDNPPPGNVANAVINMSFSLSALVLTIIILLTIALNKDLHTRYGCACVAYPCTNMT